MTGRFAGEGPFDVRVRGRAGRETVELAVGAAATAAQPRALPAVWARRKIQVLSDLSLHDAEEDYGSQIRALALNYGLVSAYTSYVAVDASGQTSGEYGVTVPVSVPTAAGVRYRTTVGR